MRRTDLPYAGGLLSAALYAYWLEQRERKYHPDVTWLNVARGIALTGGWVAVRIAQGAPGGDADRGARWAWWVTLRMFIATGIPVVGWELLAQDGRAKSLLAYLRRRRDGYPAATAGKPGQGSGEHRNAPSLPRGPVD